MSIESLKNQARRHEQREEWAKALALYLKALDQSDDDEDPDIALLNRVGDLQIRLGDIDGAMVNYERAIDYYLDADLANNAIALCRKITRSAPNRASAYLRMGQIRARQGFMVDARQNFLTYAELQQAKGGVDEALRALGEFVDLAPEDVETRLFLADLLAGMDRTDEAIPHFHTSYRRLLASGDEDAAARLATRIRELDPDGTLPTAEAPAPRPAPTSSDDEVRGFESTSMGGDFGVDEAPVATETEAEEGEVPVEADLAFSDLAFEESAQGEEREVEPSTAPDPGGSEFGALDFGPVTDEEDIPKSDDLEDDATPLPTFGYDSEEGAEEELEDDDSPLPLMGFEGEDRVDEDQEGGESELPLPELGSDEEEPTPLQSAWEESAADAPDTVEASDTAPLDRELEELRETISGAPDDLGHRQRLVELAYRVDDRQLLISAFLELAGTLRRLGEVPKAQAVYRQVLNLDARNAEAIEALGPAAVSPPAGAPRGQDATAKGEEFVDLGSLIRDEEQTGSTRWVVSAQAPSGDEQADFSQMLQQFKAKVSENLSADDAKAHYDLGTAYKDMGLFDEAIGEFQQALRAQPGHLPTFEMLGQCFLEKGEPEIAIRSLERAREISFQVEDDLLGIYYYLGRGYEATGNKEGALEFYEKVFSLDINFRDVTERLRTLR